MNDPIRTVFLDFEASSLEPEGWPIEVGLSWIEVDRVITDARLIRPQPDWPLSAWSPMSEAVHGIPFDMLLSEGQDAAQVARWYLRMTADASVVSDAAKFERQWLRPLLASLESGPTFDLETEVSRVENMHAVVERMLDDEELDWFYERLERSKAPHRAGPDSARLARALLKVSQGR